MATSIHPDRRDQLGDIGGRVTNRVDMCEGGHHYRCRPVFHHRSREYQGGREGAGIESHRPHDPVTVLCRDAIDVDPIAVHIPADQRDSSQNFLGQRTYPLAANIPDIGLPPLYAEEVLRTVLAFCDEPATDIDASLAARLQRQQVVYRGNHRFYFILAEQVLRTCVGTADVMVEQTDRLLTAMSLPRVVLGIVPSKHRYTEPTNNFIMFDSRMVQVETVSAELTITQPSEIALYERAFHRLKDQAVHGREARAMITEAMNSFINP